MLTVRNEQKQQMAAANGGKPVVQPCPRAKTWIEFHLLDDDGNPVPGQPYKVKLPDGSLVSGSLDSDGKARLDGIDPGQASICFTEIDGREWARQ